MEGTRQPKTWQAWKRGAPWSIGRRNVRPANVGVVAGRRYYSSGLGRWTNRDPIGEKGGTNVYGALGGNPLSALDALGLDATTPTCNCCCCPKELKITDVKKIKRKNLLGHEFNVRWKLEFKERPEGGGRKPCSYQWIETTNYPAPEWMEEGMVPDEPKDLGKYPAYRKGWDEHMAKAPCSGELLGKDYDDPVFPVLPGGGTQNRFLLIRIRIVSGCSDCPDAEVVFRQKLHVSGMVIGPDDWKESWSDPAPKGGNDGGITDDFPYK